MARSNGADMVYRYSWLAAFASVAFAFALLNELIRGTVEGPPWQFVVLAGLMLGAVITWAGLTYRLPTWAVTVINAVAAVIALVRVAAPETTWLFFPTSSSFSSLNFELERAIELIRTGVEPVQPVPGLVVIVMILFWILGGLVVWGLQRNHPYVALLPPLIVGLQLATMDRLPSGIGRIVVFLGLVTGTLLAITVDSRDQTSGRMARPGAWATAPRFVTPGAAAVLGVTMLASLATVGVFRDTVPYDGVVTWRQASGLTGCTFCDQGISYNPFISIQRSLVEQSDADVFVATVDGDVPADQIYFRMVTMEGYSGGQFSARRPVVGSIDEPPWELEDMAFAGPRETVDTLIQVTRLRMDWLPAAYSAENVAAERSIVGNIGVRAEDGALLYEGGRTYSGMTYQVTSNIPQPDLAALASTEEGRLSAVFRAAAEDEELAGDVPEPIVPELRPEPFDPEVYLELPEDLDLGIGNLARQVTRNLETPFEQALALEAFLRTFNYSTEVEPGHSSDDLAAWLTDDTEPGYRTGYCEQFATAMAVMARTLDIHSRVVLGFTPGDLLSDGRVVVRDRNAHAWVELWMPAQGWVQFDPTPRSDGVNPTRLDQIEGEYGFDVTAYLDVPDPEILTAPLPNPDLFLDQLPDDIGFVGGSGSDETDTGFSLPAWAPLATAIAGLVLLAAGLIPGVKWWRRRRRMRRLETGDISAAWEEITSRLTDLRVPPNPTATPAQAAAEVDPVMAPLASVYARSLYGPAESLAQTHVDAATTSLRQTEEVFITKYSRWERTAALYRTRTVTPKWVRRLLARRRR